MTTVTLVLEILVYSLALWLGLYLIARDPAKPRLSYAGLGLIAYALSLATDILGAYAPTSTLSQLIVRLHWPLLFFPALFWLGAIIHLSRQIFTSSLGVLLAATLFFTLGASLLIFPLGWLPRGWLLLAVGLDLLLLGLAVLFLMRLTRVKPCSPTFCARSITPP